MSLPIRATAAWSLAWVGAVIVVQALVVLAPGDAIDTLPDPALRAQLAADWGLDRPPVERVLAGTARALTGAWGSSWTVRPGAPVTGLVADALTASTPILLGAWALAIGAGLALRGRRGAFALSGVPTLLLLLTAIDRGNAAVWFGLERGWWARPGFFALPGEGGLVRDALLIAALGVGSGALAEVAARLGAHDRAMDDAGFVIAAQVRRQGEARLRWRHRLVPALEAAQAVYAPLIGGLVVVERLGARPGVGDLLWRAVDGRDVPVASAVVVALTGSAVAVAWALDLARRAWDPRLRRRL